MRILLANDEGDGAGGVGTYLRAVASGLRQRGHELLYLHGGGRRTGPEIVEPTIDVQASELAAAIQAAADWAPDVCFSHNMGPLEIDAALLGRWPVVKMMHGYFGTCISARKLHAFPSPAPCKRAFGIACVAYYFPRRCGGRDPRLMVAQLRWACRQRALFPAYASVVVASAHMREEYIANGVPRERVHAIPLFAPEPRDTPRDPTTGLTVLFLGRMTDLKGGRVLVDAVAEAGSLGCDTRLVMAGDGPAREDWEQLARIRGVRATFTGWVDASARDRLLSEASVLALPGLWPEPFGLVGLEAAAAGVPAVAFDSGGVREWLHDGLNGLLVSGPPTGAAFGRALATLLRDPARIETLGRGALAVAREMSLARHVNALLERVLEPAARS